MLMLCGVAAVVAVLYPLLSEALYGVSYHSLT